jgi:hypothetical protein
MSFKMWQKRKVTPGQAPPGVSCGCHWVVQVLCRGADIDTYSY